MTPTIGSLWSVQTSSTPRAVWRLDRVIGNDYWLMLVRLDPVNLSGRILGEEITVSESWFLTKGESVEPIDSKGY